MHRRHAAILKHGRRHHVTVDVIVTAVDVIAPSSYVISHVVDIGVASGT